MSLNRSLANFKREQADAASRNIAHSRPAGAAPARVSTPQPGADSSKRKHDAAFVTSAGPVLQGGAGHELLTNVKFARDKLKEKSPQALPFDEIIRHLSIPLDAQKNIPLIKEALIHDDAVEFIPKSRSSNGADCFKYRPKHPVTNAEELKDYLARQTTAQGIPVKELKDGWPNCVDAINKLETEGCVLVIRHKKDNAPRTVWPDSPAYHVHIDNDFREFWMKTKLPATETEIRSELEKAGITPTSSVKEIKKVDNRKRDRKKPNRRGGKTTNQHMLGILKDYSRR